MFNNFDSLEFNIEMLENVPFALQCVLFLFLFFGFFAASFFVSMRIICLEKFPQFIVCYCCCRRAKWAQCCWWCWASLIVAYFEYDLMPIYLPEHAYVSDDIRPTGNSRSVCPSLQNSYEICPLYAVAVNYTRFLFDNIRYFYILFQFSRTTCRLFHRYRRHRNHWCVALALFQCCRRASSILERFEFYLKNGDFRLFEIFRMKPSEETKAEKRQKNWGWNQQTG